MADLQINQTWKNRRKVLAITQVEKRLSMYNIPLFSRTPVSVHALHVGWLSGASSWHLWT